MVPKSKNIWVFGSWFGQKFADNPKYLFLYTERDHPEIRAIWLTHNTKVLSDLQERGCEAYKIGSMKSFFYSIRAGCVIVSSGLNDVNAFIVGRAKKVELWHGTPLKKIIYDDEFYFLPSHKATGRWGKLIVHLKNKISPLRPFNLDLLITSSEEVGQNLASAFKVNTNQVYVTGYPRNDALFDVSWLTSNKYDYLDNVRSEVDFKYVITYLPTWRERDEGKVDLLGRYNFEIDAIQYILERLKAIFIIKAHYVNKKLDLSAGEKILQRMYTPSDEELPDIYPLLKETNILITDYSSVYFDYLLLDRPIIFAPFDINEYVKDDRELYYDYDKVTPGPKAKNWPEVLRLIQEVMQKDDWKQERKAVCNRFNKFRDNKSSERVFQAIKEVLEVNTQKS